MAMFVEVALSNALAATALAVLAAAVTCCCRRPALGHGMWLLVLVKLITPALVPISIPWPRAELTESPPVAAPADAGLLPALAAPELPEPHPVPSAQTETMIVVVPQPAEPAPSKIEQKEASWPDSLLGPWLGGSLLWFAWTAFSIIRFRRVLRYARPAPGRLCQQVSRLAEQMGLKRVPRVALVGGAVSPMIWAVGRTPTLLFPGHLLERLDEQQLQTLLAHELAHVRRGDHLVRLLELIVTGLYWWHPVVWWARREIHEAEEQCCDAWVVSTVDSAGRTYAIALLQAVAFVSKTRAVLPATASGIGQVPHLRRRLTMILETRTPRSLSWTGWAGLCGVGLLLLPLVPVRAQYSVPERAAKPDQPDQQRIEKAVRKAMEYLAQEQQADTKKGKPKSKADSKAIQKAQAEVELAEANLKVAEARLAEAQSRLARLQGKAVRLPSVSGTVEVRAVPVQVGKGEANYVILRTYSKEALNRAPLTGSVSVVGVVPPSPAGAPPRAGSVEDKLDRLQREIEELRREMKRQRAGNTNNPQRFRFRVQPTTPPPAPAPSPPPAQSSTTPPIAPAPELAPPTAVAPAAPTPLAALRATTPPVPATPAAPPRLPGVGDKPGSSTPPAAPAPPPPEERKR